MDQSSTPWRVFDAPSAGNDAGVAQPTGTAVGAAPLAGMASHGLAIAAIAGALVIGALAIVIAMSGATSAIVDGPLSSARAGASGAVVGATQLIVDVTGAVARPGLYRLAAGSRVGDAVDAAGGFSPRVDVERVGRELNLAAALADGAQVHVPSRDEPAGGSGTGGTAAPGGGGSGGKLVNLNTASEAELDALSGIGPVTAGKIIESRAGAPFKTVDELRDRGLVGDKTFEKIRALLTIR